MRSKQAPNPSILADLIEKHRTGAEPKVAPDWDFEPGTCPDFPFRIARDGNWYYHGTPIERKELCKLFSSVLRRDREGNFYLVAPGEQGRIEVEDAPFTAVEVIVAGEGRDRMLTFRTNLDHMVTADADHPIRVAEHPETGEPSPYVLVRDNLEALILRPQFYEMVDLCEEHRNGGFATLGLWSGGVFFQLGRVEEAAGLGT
ncbi:MAG: DUF1285 domain-containing protein [Pseudomonadota bacterium]